MKKFQVMILMVAVEAIMMIIVISVRLSLANNLKFVLTWLPFCLDIDECTSKPNVCGEGNECRNVIGGHVCNCNTGYEATPDGKACVGTYCT